MHLSELFEDVKIQHQTSDLCDVAQWLQTTPEKLSIKLVKEPIQKFINQIREMYGTYSEFPEDEDRTNTILKLIKHGNKPYPIYVEANDPNLFVMEGRHRMVAFWLAGMKMLPVAYVKIQQHESKSYQPPELSVGDEVKVGKWKNRKAEIKGFKKDENNQPVLKTTKGDQKLFKPRISKLMKESPLADYQPLGDFSKPGPFTGVDKKLVPHQVNQLKAAKFLENTPYDFRLFFSNLPGTGRFSEYGPMPPEKIQSVFGEQSTQILANSQNAITVVFVGNKGDAKVMLTPWMMAHRFGHAIQAGVRKQNRMTPLRGSGTSAHDGGWPDAEQYFFRTVNNMLENYYGKLPKFTQPDGMDYNLVAEYNALFNAMGTQRSSRSNKIKRPYEFLYELFAQYLKDGRITLNPMPVNLGYGRQAWGNPSKYMNLKPEYRDEDTRQSEALALGDSLSEYFAEVLRRCVGNIYVM